MRKIITLGIMLLFLGMTISSSTGLYLEKQSIKPMSFGNTLYVGGNGTGNYTTIQDAIDDASDGDTVFVYTGMYYEHLLINKSLKLNGENKLSTKIIGLNYEIVIFIISDFVSVSNFTIQGTYLDYGIYIHESKFCIVDNNRIENNSYGIVSYNSSFIKILHNGITDNKGDGVAFFPSDNSIIEKNYIMYNGRNGISMGDSQNSIIRNNQIQSNGEYGIKFYFSDNLTITNNIIYENWDTGIDGFNSNSINISDNTIRRNKGHGIEVWNSNSGYISGNLIRENNLSGVYSLGGNRSTFTKNRILRNNKSGIELMWTYESNISYNTISENDAIGCYLNWSWDNKIICNTFIDNHRDAFFSTIIDIIIFKDNIWDGNYWSRPRILPKLILGNFILLLFWIKIPLIAFDWRPAQEPYDIGV